MHVDNLPQPGKHQVRRTRQCPHVQPIPKPHPMHKSPHDHFGGRVRDLTAAMIRERSAFENVSAASAVAEFSVPQMAKKIPTSGPGLLNRAELRVFPDFHDFNVLAIPFFQAAFPFDLANLHCTNS